MKLEEIPQILMVQVPAGNYSVIEMPATTEQTIELLKSKLNEAICHINDLEQKLLSAEERMEAEDIKEADAALKRNKFVSMEDLEDKLLTDEEKNNIS